MNPRFPEFKTLTIEDRSTLVEFSRLFPGYTEFNFTYMFVWNLREPISYCFLNDNLIVRFMDIQSCERLLTILGDNEVEKTVDEILSYSKANNMGDVLQNIPEVIAQNIMSNDKYVVTEDSKYHDYVLSIHEIAEMRASKFRGKRNLLNRFTKSHGHLAHAKELDLTNDHIKIQIKRVMDEWRLTFDGSNEDILYEFQAIGRAISHAKQLNLRCFGTYVNGQLESFTIFEIVASKTMILHFDKATRAHKGLGEHHKNHLAKHLAAEKIELINYQDDLGIPALKEAKMHYHPVGYLRKYTVSHSETHKAGKSIDKVTI